MQFLRYLVHALILSVWLFVFCAPDSLAEQSRHVILISIDGLAAYHLENPNLNIPNIRALIKEGVWAESSETVFPSITHPSHTTLTTGVSPRVHGVIGNIMTNRATGETFHITNKPRLESVKVRTLFDAARERGLTTAAFFWPETKQDPSIDYNIPEVFASDGKPDMSAVKPEFLKELREAGVPIEFYYRWYSDLNLHGAGDAILAEAAAHVIRRHKPGLLAIHILITDKIQHTYGPSDVRSEAAISTADYCVGILRRAAEEAGILNNTTFLVTADHGFHTVPFAVNLYPLFQKSGLVDRVALHPDGWKLWVELGRNFDSDSDAKTLEEVFTRALQLEGVARVIRPEEFHGLGLPKYEEDVHIPGHYMIVADINTHLAADPAGNQTDRFRKKTLSHGHGYLPDHPRMYPALVISGFGTEKGKRIPHVRAYDVAPTIAFLLGLKMTDLPGRTLNEALIVDQE